VTAINKIIDKYNNKQDLNSRNFATVLSSILSAGSYYFESSDETAIDFTTPISNYKRNTAVGPRITIYLRDSLDASRIVKTNDNSDIGQVKTQISEKFHSIEGNFADLSRKVESIYTFIKQQVSFNFSQKDNASKLSALDKKITSMELSINIFSDVLQSNVDNLEKLVKDASGHKDFHSKELYPFLDGLYKAVDGIKRTSIPALERSLMELNRRMLDLQKKISTGTGIPDDLPSSISTMLKRLAIENKVKELSAGVDALKMSYAAELERSKNMDASLQNRVSSLENSLSENISVQDAQTITVVASSVHGLDHLTTIVKPHVKITLNMSLSQALIGMINLYSRKQDSQSREFASALKGMMESGRYFVADSNKVPLDGILPVVNYNDCLKKTQNNKQAMFIRIMPIDQSIEIPSVFNEIGDKGITVINAMMDKGIILQNSASNLEMQSIDLYELVHQIGATAANMLFEMGIIEEKNNYVVPSKRGLQLLKELDER